MCAFIRGLGVLISYSSRVTVRDCMTLCVQLKTGLTTKSQGGSHGTQLSVGIVKVRKEKKKKRAWKDFFEISHLRLGHDDAKYKHEVGQIKISVSSLTTSGNHKKLHRQFISKFFQLINSSLRKICFLKHSLDLIPCKIQPQPLT